MKKTLLFALVLGLAVMFAVPAFAFKIESGKDTTFYFGALILTDLGAWSRDADLVKTNTGRGGATDRTELILNVPRHSRLRGVLEVGSVGGYWELGLGGDNQLGNAGNPQFPGNAYNVETRKFYGYYKFGNCTLLAGKTDGHFFSVVPAQNLGFDTNNHVLGFGWGSIYDGRTTQVRFSQDVSKTFGYDISFVQPVYYTELAGTALANQSMGTLPMTALKLRMNFGAVSLMPAGVVQYVKWNDLPGNADDNMTAWAVMLPVVVKAGAFTGTFQALYGQNLGGGPLGLQSSFWSYKRNQDLAIKNSTGWNGFMDLAFTAGAVTPHFYLGYDYVENDLFVGSDKNNMRSMYGVSVNWKIADSFYIAPEFTFYDYGKDPTKINNPSIGKEWLGGVQFQFVF